MERTTSKLEQLVSNPIVVILLCFQQMIVSIV